MRASQRITELQSKPSIKTCDCKAAYVKHVDVVIMVFVAPDL
jgi:hypothetical protein